MVNKTIALILGGGAGSRLKPLTTHRSKPAVPIGGKYRLIDIPISNCLNSGIKRMFVLTQFNSASLNQHIKNTYHFDIFGQGFVDILAAEQTPGNESWFEGTADAVRQTSHHMANHDFEMVMVLSGDQLYQMDLKALAEYHQSQKADLTIATIPVKAKDATGFGIMKVNKEGLIGSFVEKPEKEVLPEWKSAVPAKFKKEKKEYLASMGIYVFSKGVLSDLLQKNPDATDFGKELIPYAINNKYKVASYAYQGYWEDIGTINSFFQANIAFTDNVPDFNLFDNKSVVFTRPRLLPPSKVFGTYLNQAVIADGCIIHAKTIDRSVVGIRSRIGEHTEISNTVIFGNDYYETIDQITKGEKIPLGIGNDCFIRNAIIDKDVRIGEKVHIHGSMLLDDEETESYSIKDGVVVVKKGAVIPDKTKIGFDRNS